MRMRRFSFSFTIILCFVGFYTSVFSDQFAYTQDGRQVLLKDDGTWEYVKKEKEDKKKFHFRKTRWGMSSESVKATEKSETYSDENNLIGYETRLNNLDCFIAYYFVKEQLASARYIFNEKHSNKNDYIHDFLAMKKLLIKKYGPVKEDIVHWDNELYKDDTSEYGFAVSLGHLIFGCTWETDETEISIELTGENYEIHHIIFYKSKILNKSLVETKEEEVLDDL